MGTSLAREAWKGPPLPKSSGIPRALAWHPESPGIPRALASLPRLFTASPVTVSERPRAGEGAWAGAGCRGEAAFPLCIQQSARPRPSGTTLPRVETVAEGCRPPRSWENRSPVHQSRRRRCSCRPSAATRAHPGALPGCPSPPAHGRASAARSSPALRENSPPKKGR